MPALESLILWNAAAAWFMTGVIWFVQIVHYPLMARAAEVDWVGYEIAHRRRTGWIVGPAMLIEAATAALVLVAIGVENGAGDAGRDLITTAWVATGLLALIWVSTFGVQVPLHRRLSCGFDVRAHRRLVSSNWIRTAAWSARAGLMTSLLGHGGAG